MVQKPAAKAVPSKNGSVSAKKDDSSSDEDSDESSDEEDKVLDILKLIAR